MKSSRNKNQGRRFFDVVISEKKFIERQYDRLITHGQTVNLSPTLLRRYQIPILFILSAIGIFFWLKPSIFVKAESADFYPTTCVGDWKNPQTVQGHPDFLVSSSTGITEDNSAVFPGDTSQIFCGGFLPETFASSGKITNVAVTLVWQIGDIKPGVAEDGVFQPIPSQAENTSSTSSSTTAESTSTDSSSSNGTDANVNQTDLPKDPTTTEPTSFLYNLFFPVALAQDVPSSEVPSPVSVDTPPPPTSDSEVVAPQTDTAPSVTVPSDNDSSQSSPSQTDESNQTGQSSDADSSTVIILGPPIRATLDELPSSSLATSSIEEASGTTSSSFQEVPPPPFIPDETFLLIKYSLDGNTWTPLKRVGEENWQHLTLTLPVTSWEDLNRIQIRVEGTETTHAKPLPKVLLHGMLVEVHYEKSLFEEKSLNENSVHFSANPPQADQEALQAAMEKLHALTGSQIILSQQFQSSSTIAFKAVSNGQYDIFIYDDETKKIKQATNNAGTESEPTISDNFVAWAYADNDQPGEVYLYDIKADDVQKLTNDSFADQPPYFKDNALIWEKFDSRGHGHLFQYDLASQKMSQIGNESFETEPEPADPDQVQE